MFKGMTIYTGILTLVKYSTPCFASVWRFSTATFRVFTSALAASSYNFFVQQLAVTLELFTTTSGYILLCITSKWYHTIKIYNGQENVSE